MNSLRWCLGLVTLWSSLFLGCPRSGINSSDSGVRTRDSPYRDASNDWTSDLRFDDEFVDTLPPDTLPAVDAPCRSPLLGRVERTTDGDTIHVVGVSVPGDWQVRLIGIDTPEVQHGDQELECFGAEAQSFTRELIEHLVWLTFDEECLDSYGRMLAYVWIGNQESDMWNRQLARRGFARTLSIPPNTGYARTFQQDVNAARNEELGLWSLCD